MNEVVSARPVVLPYCRIVGQEMMRRALEIAFVCPAVGGILLTGQRGTAKSTIVRAFARMVSGALPVTLPIGATDDRVLGGWRVASLLESDAVWQPGLLEEAAASSEPGMLYIDEVNLLDDHLVNIILDVSSTGILTVQRESAAREAQSVRFLLVGTMNPEEGSLRPQLLDRFGLVVPVESVRTPDTRRLILETVLRFDEESHKPQSAYMDDGYRQDAARRNELAAAKDRLGETRLTDSILQLVAAIAAEFQVEGHRAELVMARAAQALAAIENTPMVMPRHVAAAAPLALVHRRATGESGSLLRWSPDDGKLLLQHVALEDIS